MRLDLNNLVVDTFATDSATPIIAPTPDTGQGGPESYCYICYETGNTDPACQPQPYPETIDHPCTIYEFTCPACA